jgi:hypothetical protein
VYADDAWVEFCGTTDKPCEVPETESFAVAFELVVDEAIAMIKTSALDYFYEVVQEERNFCAEPLGHRQPSTAGTRTMYRAGFFQSYAL